MEQPSLNVLVIEDSTADFRLLKEQLSSQSLVDFRLTHAKTLKEGLALLPTEKIDTVLLDLDLPDSNRVDTLQKVRESNPALAVIVLTGLASEEIGVDALVKGAQDYLVKGQIQPDALVRSIRYAIERKKSEAALMRVRDEWERTFNSVPDMIAILDDRHNIVRVNNSMAKHLALKPEECIGKPCYRYIHGLDKPHDPCPHFATLRDGKEHVQEIREDRLGMDLLVSTTPLMDNSGKMIGSVHVARDITLHKQAEGILKRDKEVVEDIVKERTKELMAAHIELDKARRLSDIGTLAATVAHELRNPLAAIRMATYNIKRKKKDLPIDSHLVNIEKKVAESDQIINNLLFYSRLRVSHFEEINIYECLNECIELSEKQYQEQEAVVEKQIQSIQAKIIHADPLQIKEVFNNILNNAFDAVADRKGRVVVKAELNASDTLRISIEDNGIGMDDEQRQRALEPFFTTKAKGTGLGLSVCSQIIELHNCSLDIASKKDKGTTVTITLPVKQDLNAKTNPYS